MTEATFELIDDRPVIDKSVGSSLRYGLNITAWETSAGDTATTASATAGGSLAVGAAGVAAGIVTALVSGGTVGLTEPVTFTWSTAGGQTDSRTIWLRGVRR